MFKERVKGFLAGVCVTALLAGTATVFAKQIDVAMGGIKVYWDGVEQTLRNAKGDKVEPLIYDGTTYVPLRALAGLLGKDVDWNQNEMSVYIGEKPTAETTPIDKFPKDKIEDSWTYTNVRTGENAKFNLKDKEIQCSNLIWGRSWNTDPLSSNTYILNGQYSRLVGKSVFPYESVGSDRTGKIIFYSVENDGTETEIVSYELKQTQNPIDVDVNLRGVVNLRIKWTDSIALYDASFLGN